MIQLISIKMKVMIKFLIAALISYVSLSNAQLQLNQRWKERNGDVVIVPYSEYTATATQRSGRPTDDARRNAAIKLLNEQAKAVKLVEKKRRQKAYIEFRSDANGCYSDVGRIESGTKQILNDSDCLSERSILQKLLYTLGMFPEHNRKDRDQFVTINLQNVPEKTRKDFNIVDDLESSDLGTPYDYESITHYTDASVITMKNGSSIKERDELSQIDILELRLMYQCLSGPRSFSEYNSNPCTSDCKCWEGAVGCGADDDDDDDACMGDLKCISNVCTRIEVCNDLPSNWVDSLDNSCQDYATNSLCAEFGNRFANDGKTANEVCCACGGGSDCTDVPNGWVDSLDNSCQVYATNSLCAAYGNMFANDGTTANEACCACGGGSNIGTGSDMGTVFINLKNNNSPNLCITLRDGSTTDGTALIHSQCNEGSNQKWYWDTNNYIRSALDISKCIVGSSGSSNQGTNLVINTCFARDDRFKWNHTSDLSIRPINNDAQCISPSPIEQSIGVVLYMSDCANAPNQQWRGILPTSRRVLQTANCVDDPPGWYNSFGDNCEWYADDTNCEDYGSGLSNFGKTANQACCSCGGGSVAKASNVTPDFAAVDQKCWDTISDWVDSVGDGCFWYSQGNNCDDYGKDFRSSGLITVNKTAAEVCCACGGGSSSPPAGTREATPDRCSDSPSRWVDDNNDGCDFYAADDNCKKFGDQFRGVNNKTANEACCACGGGLSIPTKSPTKSRCGLFNLSIFCPFTFCGIFGRLFRLCKN